LEERLRKGDYRIEWNGKVVRGRELRGGVYFIKLEPPPREPV